MAFEQDDPNVPASSSAAGVQRQSPTIRQVDRPDVAETFADSVTNLIFDGQSLRIEFGVTRLDEVKPNAPITGARYTAWCCRRPRPSISSTACSRSAQR
jgi:hypothetical protein